MNKCGVLLLVASFFVAACESSSEQRNRGNNDGSCICTFEYRPVCGSDGKTYPNACALGCQQRKDSSLQMKHEGQCGSEVSRFNRAASCACTREYAPQCGSDGVTYNNPCLMRCAAAGGVRKVHSGQCGGRKGRAAQPLEVPSCSCTKERNPQCGTDGVTYANLCIFRCTGEVKGVQLKHAGSCSSSDRKTREAPIEVPLCPCTKERNPQCGTDGVTYANPCQLRCAAKVKDIQLKHPGPCGGRKTRAAQSGPLCACPKNLRKVCGTNGVTYLNPCLLECSAKVDNTLSLLHEGPCESSRNTREGQGPIEVPLCPCTKENNPQCGTDGVTYANPCLLRCAAKVKDIKLKHPGECGSR